MSIHDQFAQYSRVKRLFQQELLPTSSLYRPGFDTLWDTGLPTSEILFPYFVEKISVFWVTFPYPLICSSSDSEHSLWQLPIYSGGTHHTPSGNTSGFFRCYRNRKWGRKACYYYMWKREDWMFWWLKRYLKVLRHKMPQILTDLQPKTGKLCSGSSTLCDRTDRAQFPYFVGQISTPVFCM